MSTLHRFCISHKEPLLPHSWYDDCIALGDFQTDSALHVSQLDQFWHAARPIAYGAAGTYVLPIAIDKFASAAELIEISSYRKRILPSPEGVESQSYGYPTMRELGLEESKKKLQLSSFIPRPQLGFLVAQPLFFENTILGQYAASHRRKDLINYTSLAVDMDVLDKNSATELLRAKYFIPGGVELGIFPKAWLVKTVTGIELVGRQFLQRYGNRLKKYDRYQVRAVGFLSERLGSYLLLRHLTEKYSNNIPSEIFGYMTVIVEGDSAYATGLSDRPMGGPRWYPFKRKRAQ